MIISEDLCINLNKGLSVTLTEDPSTEDPRILVEPTP
jgi:hypothetical protein